MNKHDDLYAIFCGPVHDHRPDPCKFFLAAPPAEARCTHPDRALLFPAESCTHCHVTFRHHDADAAPNGRPRRPRR